MSTSTAAPAGELTPPQCAACGAHDVGRFCSNCGSALADRRDLSVKHFLREAAAAVTDLDSALIGSFRALLLRPGELTIAYFRGDRQQYLPPFRVFLFCNLLYFVIVAQFGITVLTAPLATQLDEMSYRQVTRAVMIKRYPARVLALLFIGTRRFFAEHLVFATHLVGFFLLLIPATGIALLGYYRILLLTTSFKGSDSELPYALAMLLLFSTYAYVAQRVVYGSGRLATGVRTALLVATVVPIIVAFKFVLFFVTLYWIA